MNKMLVFINSFELSDLSDLPYIADHCSSVGKKFRNGYNNVTSFFVMLVVKISNLVFLHHQYLCSKILLPVTRIGQGNKSFHEWLTKK